MSARRSFEQRLTDWLDEGPVAAPREDLAALLQAFPEVRQRRPVGRETIPMPVIARLAVAAALVVVVGGFAITSFGPAVGDPAASPAPTPGWAERFGLRTSNLFKHPFQYALDTASGQWTIGTPDADVHQFGLYVPETGLYTGKVVLIRAFAVRQDVCSASGGPLLRDPTPRELVDYLKALPGFKVTEQAPTTVDGREALVADIDQLPRSSRPCDDIWIWTNNDVPFSQTGGEGGWTRRLVAFDVDGDTVVAVIYAEPDITAWIPTAMALLDSIHFLPAGPDASPTP